MSYQILKAVIANMLKELKKTVSRAEKRYNENVQSKRKDQHTDEKKKTHQMDIMELKITKTKMKS